MGFNNAATCGGCEADIRASPEPPSKTPTGRISLVDGTANMVFSFTDEREHPSLAGNLGFPVRDAPAGEGGAALRRHQVARRQRRQPEGRTTHTAVCTAEPDRSPASTRQVTTAPPASWTSGGPEYPMKAVQARCPRKPDQSGRGAALVQWRISHERPSPPKTAACDGRF